MSSNKKGSCEKGNIKKKGQAHQNKYAFKHNKNSKLTVKIMSLPNEGLCQHCHSVIEWKKRYRKYRPLTSLKRCQVCEGKTVSRAYHVICEICAIKTKVCAKCLEDKSIVVEMRTAEQQEKDQKEFEDFMDNLSERERRTILRKIESGDITNTELRKLVDEKSLGKLDINFDDSDSKDDEDNNSSDIEDEKPAPVKSNKNDILQVDEKKIYKVFG